MISEKVKNQIQVVQGDITKLDCDGIVNAANRSLLGGGGVDGAIHRAAGPELLAECRTLHGCRTGEAKITKGYRLKAKYIIHTVGPIYSGTAEDAAQLADCYRNSLDLAKEYEFHSIAFPAISTGVYGYPLEDATEIAVKTVAQWLEDHADYAMQVIFCCFDARTERVYQARTLQQRKRQNGRGTVSWQAGWTQLPNPVLKMEKRLKYREIADGIFVDRPNRFIAHVEVNGAVETVHVKNTGRCKELLLPGTAVRLEVSDNPKRKTKYDLVAVHKQGLGWVNMDSQAPNKVVGEWLAKQGYDYIKPEFTYGKSRIDFYMEKGEQKYLLEVKGCTLEVDGIGYFPDAPTERGVKHLHELAQAQQAGYRCAVAFVIQMEGITEVRPNVSTQPEFGTALAEAKAAGVRVLFLLCHVGRDSLEIVEQRKG